MVELDKIPTHVAIIMDGNGRWAHKRGQQRLYGHAAGADVVRETVKSAVKFGIKYLTIYTFSTENWGRPQDEVDGLMELLAKMLESETPDLKRNGVRLRFIGDRSAFSPSMLKIMADSEAFTCDQTKMTLIVAMNYSGRSEIQYAMRKIADRVKYEGLDSQDIDDKMISQSLYTADFPDPDLLIRTSGECRLSNFLLWQSAYTELYFTDVLWPDFTEDEFVKALCEYSRRDRRYGKI